MLTLYVSPTALSCRKAKIWLVEHQIEFQERNIFSSVLSPAELNHLHSLMQKSKQPLLSLFPISFIENTHSPEEEWREALVQCPALLTRPILVDHDHIEVGFNEFRFQRWLLEQ